MSGHGEKLSRKQEQAIAALLTQPTQAQAATTAGVSVATLRRWLKRTDFQQSYRAARRQAFEGAVAYLQGASVEAVETLKRNLRADTPGVQVRAAKTILEQTYRAMEVLDLAERVAQLETHLPEAL